MRREWGSEAGMNVTAGRALAARMAQDPSIVGAVCNAFTAALRGDHKPDGFEYIVRHYGDDGALIEETRPRLFATKLGLIYGRSRWPDHRIEQLRREAGTDAEFAVFDDRVKASA